MSRITIHAALLGMLLLAGCRGTTSTKPPVHPNLNMDYQERVEAQEANPFFADGRGMRLPVAGTVARGMLREDPRFYEGKDESGAFVATMPVPVTQALVLRGQDRYNIYCAVCHGKAGDGLGIIMTGGYGYTPAPSYHDPIVAERMAADGYVYDVIANGVRTMPGYAPQVPVADRWAITAYIRALQRSQRATATDVPPDVLTGLQ